jgi:hypothetical protein
MRCTPVLVMNVDPRLDAFGAMSVVRAVLFDHYASQFVAGATTYLMISQSFVRLPYLLDGLEVSHHDRAYLSSEVLSSITQMFLETSQTSHRSP